jgi:hypothetical protein
MDMIHGFTRALPIIAALDGVNVRTAMRHKLPSANLLRFRESIGADRGVEVASENARLVAIRNVVRTLRRMSMKLVDDPQAAVYCYRVPASWNSWPTLWKRKYMPAN